RSRYPLDPCLCSTLDPIATRAARVGGGLCIACSNDRLHFDSTVGSLPENAIIVEGDACPHQPRNPHRISIATSTQTGCPPIPYQKTAAPMEPSWSCTKNPSMPFTTFSPRLLRR